MSKVPCLRPGEIPVTEQANVVVALRAASDGAGPGDAAVIPPDLGAPDRHEDPGVRGTLEVPRALETAVAVAPGGEPRPRVQLDPGPVVVVVAKLDLAVVPQPARAEALHPHRAGHRDVAGLRDLR